jgi:hypothetical protein
VTASIDAPIAIAKRREAEVAAEWFLRESLGCAETHRALRTRFARVDFYACDVMGRTRDRNYYAQVTTGKDDRLRLRRRKLESIGGDGGAPRAWKQPDVVMVLQLVRRQNPVNAARVDYYFRVHEFDYAAGSWVVLPEAVPVKLEWFRARRRAVAAEVGGDDAEVAGGQPPAPSDEPERGAAAGVVGPQGGV